MAYYKHMWFYRSFIEDNPKYRWLCYDRSIPQQNEKKGSEFYEKNKKLGLENRILIGYNIIRGSREATEN